jgi:NADH dehydrogenase FAD-containing subunit
MLESPARHRVVIVGTGFGGLAAAKSLGRAADAISRGSSTCDRRQHDCNPVE